MADDAESEIPQELRDAVEKLRNGENPPSITVRELLRYFGARRRGIYVRSSSYKKRSWVSSNYYISRF